MAEELKIINDSKEKKYLSIIAQIQALTSYETDIVANLANISAALKQQFGWWWIGFYLVKNNELVLGPFQGPVACTRIKKGKGVCGTAWEREETLIVPDVEKFSGHIACSNASKSEIVVPLFNAQNTVAAVLDADSEHLAHFDETDKNFLEELCRLIKI